MSTKITAYKLLAQDMTSYGNTHWTIGVTKTLPKKENPQMCSADVLHSYSHPVLAMLFNLIHANIANPRLFEIEIEEVVCTDSLKQASFSQTLIKELPLPKITTNQRIAFAIQCALTVYKNPSFLFWATHWLSGKDRSASAADAAAYAARAAYATNAAAYAATTATTAAAYAAAYAATNAADAAAYAATNAARAAYAARTATNINFLSIWDKAKNIS